ncbi:hypothetical protein CENSYa_1388 [Cenarchaeum symbiosum A]|uniref:Alpha/beta hydrolase n=1 Tax=Cenarchaeum symbiosum (strain A) TaxID=414004 RepID=A0RXE4_CENSY|nr:hypothetical protein CENSYa_1388 [Cenarchaeum symbiosum A]
MLTRGCYNLHTGARLECKGYRLYPRGYFEDLQSPEIAVMIHGMQNDPSDALEKFRIAKRRLRALGYRHPVVGYSYDSDVRGLLLDWRRALRAARVIARGNGAHLARFITDYCREVPGARVRLLAHSLGSELVLAAAGRLARRGVRVESIHMFGASAPADSPGPRGSGPVLSRAVRGRVVNYYAPTDAVLMAAGEQPLGLVGCKGRAFRGYVQRRVRPRDHRFKSYAEVMGSYP